MTLTCKDFVSIKDEALRTFDYRISLADPSMCWEFDAEVARLESQMVQLYGIAVLMTKNEENLEKISDIWQSMTSICDAFASHLQTLCVQHPYCSASHDKMLDIRNKCVRLRDLHN